MNKAITVTFWQFRASLSEWLDTPQINFYQAEIFSCYCAGSSPEAVAAFIELKERHTD